MTSFQLRFQTSFLGAMKPVRDKEDPDQFLNSYASLKRELLEPKIDGSVEDLHELDRVLGSPGSRYRHTDSGSPLLFMAHLLFL